MSGRIRCRTMRTASGAPAGSRVEPRAPMTSRTTDPVWTPIARGTTPSSRVRHQAREQHEVADAETARPRDADPADEPRVLGRQRAHHRVEGGAVGVDGPFGGGLPGGPVRLLWLLHLPRVRQGPAAHTVSSTTGTWRRPAETLRVQRRHTAAAAARPRRTTATAGPTGPWTTPSDRPPTVPFTVGRPAGAPPRSRRRGPRWSRRRSRAGRCRRPPRPPGRRRTGRRARR